MSDELAISIHRLRGIGVRLLLQWKIMALSWVVLFVVLITLYMLMRKRKTYIYRSVIVYTGRQMQGAAPAQSFRTVLASAKSVQRFRDIKQKFQLTVPIRTLSRQFVVKPTGRNHLIEVLYKCRDTKNAGQILNYFVKDYARSTRTFFLKHLQAREESYRRNLERHRRRLARLQKSLKQLQSRTGYLGSEYSLKPFLEEKTAAAMSYYQNHLRLKRLDTELRKLKYFLKHMSRSRVMRIEKRNPVREEWLSISAKISGLSKTYTRRHPAMRKLLAQRAALRKQMNPRTLRSLWVRTIGVNRVREKIVVRKLLLVAERAAIRKQMPILKKRMEQYEASFRNLPGVAKRYRQLLAALRQTQGTIEVLSTSHVRIASESKARRVLLDVVDPSSFYQTASTTKRRLIFAALGLLGAGLIFLICLARAIFDDRLRYPFELGEFQAHVLGEATLCQHQMDMLWKLSLYMKDKSHVVLLPMQPEDLPRLSAARVESVFLQAPAFDTGKPSLAESVDVSFPLFHNGELQRERFEHTYPTHDAKVLWIVLNQTRRSHIKKAIAAIASEQPVAILYTHSA